MKEIDRAVLRGGAGDMAQEPARERLFDVLMRRLETHAPHREAVRSLLRSATRNPPLALALNGLGINISRVLGPALGGLVIGTLGVSAAFLINAATFLGVVFAYASWRAPEHRSHLPAERFTASGSGRLELARRLASRG